MPGWSAELWFAASLHDIISQGKWRKEALPLRCPKYTLTSGVRLNTAEMLRCASLHGFSCYCKTNPPFILESRGLWFEEDVHRPSHSTAKVTNLWGSGGRQRGVGRREGGGSLIRPDLRRTAVSSHYSLRSHPLNVLWNHTAFPGEERNQNNILTHFKERQHRRE